MPTCSKCQIEKPKEEFTKRNEKHRPGGISSQCKVCQYARAELNKTLQKPVVLEKKCGMCDEIKLAGEFTKLSRTVTGLSNECRICAKKRSDTKYEKMLTDLGLTRTKKKRGESQRT